MKFGFHWAEIVGGLEKRREGRGQVKEWCWIIIELLISYGLPYNLKEKELEPKIARAPFSMH